MRLALEVGPQLWLKPNGVQHSIALAQSAESLGFETVWAGEDPDGWDAFAALSVLAANTERIHLGSGVTNPYLRHPNLIASSVATLDRASAGRAFLGLGRGEPDWYGTAFDLPIGSPYRRVDETIDLLGQWWKSDQTASIDGEMTVRAWRREFGPVTKPTIYLAAAGPKMQALAGSKTDGIRFNTLSSPVAIADGIEIARKSAIEAGRDPTAQRYFAHPSLTITERDDQIEAVLERKKAMIALIHVLPGMNKLLAGLEIEFDIDAILADVRRSMKTDEILARGGSFADLRRGGDLKAARKAIPTTLVDRVAIVGPPERVLRRLGDLAGAGVTDIFIDPSQLSDADLVQQIAEL